MIVDQAVELCRRELQEVGGNLCGVGGASAGLAILRDFIYHACVGRVTSSQALAYPYHRHVTFTYDVFHWDNLQNTIAADHFVTRDPMGRTLAFLARQIKDGKATAPLAVAADEVTSIEVSRSGLATVVGTGTAYFILADHAPETCVAGSPLTYSNFKIWKVPRRHLQHTTRVEGPPPSHAQQVCIWRCGGIVPFACIPRLISLTGNWPAGKISVRRNTYGKEANTWRISSNTYATIFWRRRSLR